MVFFSDEPFENQINHKFINKNKLKTVHIYYKEKKKKTLFTLIEVSYHYIETRLKIVLVIDT